MKKLIINGGRRLCGEVNLQGAKNSVLPILAAAAAADGISVIHNCPHLSDVDASIKILRHIGCRVDIENETVIVDSTDASGWEIPEALMREMRSSIIFLGALLSRFGRGIVAAPGGCEIGLRPIDYHLEAFAGMGVEINENGGIIECICPKGICGRRLSLNFPSVGATENIILASIKAKGETVITNAAREPEIKDLADFLNKCGADIRGAGGSIITICGVETIHSAEHSVIPDRIIASTYMAAAACTGGKITINGAERKHLAPIIPVFEESGCSVKSDENRIEIAAPEKLRRIRYIKTMPYPGFPTDSQSLITVMASIGKGTSVISESIFENRFRFVPELIRMGANIRVENGCLAIAEGVEKLHGANVAATDLRGGTALVVAGLCAEGETRIGKISCIYRGFYDIEKYFSSLGADIRSVNG